MKKAFIKYRDWKLYSDTKTTQQTYKDLKQSGAESCGCNGCKNFVLQREKVFPDEINKLFSELGIDYKKKLKLPNLVFKKTGFIVITDGFNTKEILKEKTVL